MRKSMLIVFTIVSATALSLLAGCATLPSPAKMAEEVSGFTLPRQAETESALIYVVRPSPAGSLIRFNVFLNDKEDKSEMGYTRGSQYIYFYVNPGKYKIFSNAENWAEIGLDARAGETLFLKQNPELGFIMARNSLELIPEVEGKYHVKNTDLGTIINDGLSNIKRPVKKQETEPKLKTDTQKDSTEKLDKLREGGIITEEEHKRATDNIEPPQADSADLNKKLQELDDLHKKGILSDDDYNKAKKRLTELQKLNELHQSGILSEEEYNKAKARVMEK